MVGLNRLDTKYLVIRKPSVQEDEGRYFTSGVFDSREAAQDWIGRQAGEYFGPECYMIAED